MNNSERAKRLVFGKEYFIYDIKLCKKFFGGFYYDIYYNYYDIKKHEVIEGSHKTKEESLRVLDVLPKLSSEYNYHRFNNHLINFDNLKNVTYENNTLKFYYKDDVIVPVNASKKEYCKAYAMFLNKYEAKTL